MFTGKFVLLLFLQNTYDTVVPLSWCPPVCGFVVEMSLWPHLSPRSRGRHGKQGLKSVVLCPWFFHGTIRHDSKVEKLQLYYMHTFWSSITCTPSGPLLHAHLLVLPVAQLKILPYIVPRGRYSSERWRELVFSLLIPSHAFEVCQNVQ